jgi:hypothetical protein
MFVQGWNVTTAENRVCLLRGGKLRLLLTVFICSGTESYDCWLPCIFVQGRKVATADYRVYLFRDGKIDCWLLCLFVKGWKVRTADYRVYLFRDMKSPTAHYHLYLLRDRKITQSIWSVKINSVKLSTLASNGYPDKQFVAYIRWNTMCSHWTQCVTICKTSRLMLFSEIINVNCNKQTKHKHKHSVCYKVHCFVMLQQQVVYIDTLAWKG